MNLESAYQQTRRDLLAARNTAGHWEGRLASSALSTATAISSFSMLRKQESHFDGNGDHTNEHIDRLIDNGLAWLLARQNADGGWGDTDQSYSNISTTMLVEAALNLAEVAELHATPIARAQAYIKSQGGVNRLRRRYGKDKTFAVPILTNCALAGIADWQDVSPLPFELACLPQSFYRFVQLPVVSYAIPALVAVGQVIHAKRRSWNPFTTLIRNAAIQPSLNVLLQMQPASGGFLEAIPLTSFVSMSLIGAGQGEHQVVKAGLQFLIDTVREDGSWPIDTNLATWNSTLAVNALSMADNQTDISKECWDWIAACQMSERHPFTGADPGGWGWSNLSGAVPDADDTPSAMLALRHQFDISDDANVRAELCLRAKYGSQWLLGLQNRDGGWPTFCRGWGTLPFDRSGSDLTAHAIRALHAWRDETGGEVQCDNVKISTHIKRGFQYLAKFQREDGSWYPLWFGNQDHPDEENPVYGTAKVLLAYRDLERTQHPVAQRGFAWLRSAQRRDGGWNAGFCGVDRERAHVERRQKICQDVETTAASAFSLVEETALAVEALLSDNGRASQGAARRGIDWLIEAVERKQHLEPTPIGFYFAKLWYYEDLYPLLFTTSALGAAIRSQQSTAATTA